MNGDEECNHLCDLHKTGSYVKTVTKKSYRILLKDTIKQIVVIKILVRVIHTGFLDTWSFSLSNQMFLAVVILLFSLQLSQLQRIRHVQELSRLYMVSEKFQKNCVSDFLSMTGFGV